MRFSEQHAKVAPALLAVQKEIQPIVKDAHNPQVKNKYATLDTILDTVRPLLAKHGLSVLQCIEDEHYHPTTGVLMAFAVSTTLVHVSGEWVSNRAVVAVAEIGRAERRTTPQTSGAATTYGRRYSLSAILAITTDEDNDGATNTAQRREAKARQKESAKINGAGITKHEDLTFPKTTDFPQYAGKRLAEVPTEAIEAVYKRAAARADQKSVRIAATFTEILESRRDMQELSPALASSNGDSDGLPFK